MPDIFGFAGLEKNRNFLSKNIDTAGFDKKIPGSIKNNHPEDFFAQLALKNLDGIYDEDSYFYETIEKSIIFTGHILENKGIKDLSDIIESKNFNKLSNLNGIFSSALFYKDKLYLVTDRYGFRSIYYYYDKEKNLLIFSNNINNISDLNIVKKRINWNSWRLFLHFGHFLGDETGFKDIFTIPPGSLLIFDGKKLNILKLFDISDIEIDQNLNYSNVLDSSIELFKQSIKRRNTPLKGKKTVLLSGGLDSRRIAAELKKQNACFDTYTTRGFTPVNEEKKRAKDVAETLGIKNYFINLPSKNFFNDYWKKSNRLTGYETNLHQWILPLIESLPKDIKANYDGIAGDLISIGILRSSEIYLSKNFNEIKKLNTKEIAINLVDRTPDKLVFLNKDIISNIFKEDIIDLIEKEVSKFKINENIFTNFLLMNRTRRSIALSPFKILTNYNIESFCPFLDNDFFDFIMSVPIELKLNNNLRADMAKAAYPELSSISFTNYKVKNRETMYENDINYYFQRQVNLINNISLHFLKNNKIFSNKDTLPRVIKELYLSLKKRDWPTTVFSTSCLVFYEWLERHFH